ncbi:hypothetical protein ACNQR9_25925 [Mycolicibacterium peregrinum]
MNYIEQQIRIAISEQAQWEAFEIPDDKLNRLAEAVRSQLGLTEFECDGERWWSTKFYPVRGIPT